MLKFINFTIDNVAVELKISFPNLKGFSVRNLKYMKSFYNEYKEDKKIRKWYMQKCLDEGCLKVYYYIKNIFVILKNTTVFKIVVFYIFIKSYQQYHIPKLLRYP